MPIRNKKLLFLEHRRTQHGKWVWYFRRDRRPGTPRIRLPDLYGTPEFMAAYQAALAGGAVETVTGKAVANSIKWLIDKYRDCDSWKNLGGATRKARELIFRDLIGKRGDDPVIKLNEDAVKKYMKTKTLSMANTALNALRVMFDWAVAEKLLNKNPAAAIEYLKALKNPDPDAEEGHKTWTEEDCSRFEATYPLGTLERLAYTVFLYTGLRVSDACRVGYQHVNKQDGVIQIRNQKTGAVVWFPILPPLREALDATRHGELTWIIGPRGRPWGKAHLGDWFSEAAKKAGLVNCTAHGLRKAAATRCANAGASEEKLKALFGWTRSETAAKYTRKANKKRLAIEAAQGLIRDFSGNGFAHTTQTGVGDFVETTAVSVA